MTEAKLPNHLPRSADTYANSFILGKKHKNIQKKARFETIFLCTDYSCMMAISKTNIFGLKTMMKSGLEFFILKFH